jgi:HlyD family secretion protein
MKFIAVFFKVFFGISSLLLVACQAEKESMEQVVVPANVTASAELISLSNATIGPPNISRMWQYKIQKMAAENKQVKKGEVILVFDGQRIKNNLIDRKSQLKAAIKKAESDKLKDDATTQDLILKLAEAERLIFDIKLKA